MRLNIALAGLFFGTLSFVVVPSCCAPTPVPAPPAEASAEPEPYPGFLTDAQMLQHKCPLDKTARVIIDPMPDRFGQTEDCTDAWEIRLSPAPPAVMRDTLIHEWAHALRGHGGGPAEEDHGPLWGVCFAQCYRAVME